MKLVIVESPAKCETIKRYLGKDYEVKASLGHIRDLATSGKYGLGVDIDNDFAPKYVISRDKINIVNDLQYLANKSEEVILATDPDREGEAISWHLATVLGLDINKTKRLEFHEITKDSITYALENPRTIDMKMVASQETRRILDRIIGFRLSNLIYKKMKSRSAGRVQSAVLKIIADHDKEIASFVPEEYWNINAKTKIGSKELVLTFVGKNGKQITINNGNLANEILTSIPNSLKVASVEKSFRTKESKLPLTTSTMQQEAFAKLKLIPKETQRVAQQLYEGINVGGEHVGLITYMRTDSIHLSDTYVNHCKAYIVETFGREYLGAVKGGKASKNAQEGHEAIRPTSNYRTPESVKPYLTKEQYNLYKLIYNHTLASMMKGKKDEVLTVLLSGNDLDFKLEFTHCVFPGYTTIYKDDDSEKDYKGNFPSINVGDYLPVVDKQNEQKFTQPPQHFSEAKLVKTMEELGIGRPSTYATTIETLKQRKYVTNSHGVLESTEQGSRTAHVLGKYFPNLVSSDYTAKMEEKLDNVSEGEQSRVQALSDFYVGFEKDFKIAIENMYSDAPTPVGRKCPKCGAELVWKEGKNGPFVGCSNYPKCKYVEKEEKEVEIVEGEFCPNCGAPMVMRVDKKTGSKFMACSSYPKCKYIKQDKVAYSEKDYVKECPKCGGHLVKKKGKYGYFLGCDNYPECNYMEKIIRKHKKVKRK